MDPLSLSQSDIGFGKLETYVKLDKLGEVRGQVARRDGEEEEGGLPTLPGLCSRPCPQLLPSTLLAMQSVWPCLWQVSRWAQVLAEALRVEWLMDSGAECSLFILQVFHAWDHVPAPLLASCVAWGEVWGDLPPVPWFPPLSVEVVTVLPHGVL